MADEQSKPGRPSDYRPEFAEQAKLLCEGGATDAGLAFYFDVSRRTIRNWRAAHAEFREACNLGKDAADNEVKRSLFERATGYEYVAQKPVLGKDGIPFVLTYVEHIPADPKSIEYWLNNRCLKEWRSRQELTGKDGEPIKVDVTDADRVKALTALLEAHARAKPGST